MTELECKNRANSLMLSIDNLHSQIPRTWTTAAIYHRGMLEDGDDARKAYAEIVKSLDYIKEDVENILKEIQNGDRRQNTGS